MLFLAVGIEFAYYLPYALQLQVMAQFGNLSNTHYSLIDTLHNIGAVCIIVVPSLADRYEATRLASYTMLPTDVITVLTVTRAPT